MPENSSATHEAAAKPVGPTGQFAFGIYWLVLMAFLAYLTAKLWPQVPVAQTPVVQVSATSTGNAPAPAPAPETNAAPAPTPAAGGAETKGSEAKKTEAGEAQSKTTQKQAQPAPSANQARPSAAGGNPQAEEPKRLVALFYGIFEFTITAEVRLILLVLVVGALGASVHAATSFAAYVGNRRLASSWLWYYALRPPIGAALALIVYFVVRGGFLNPASGASVNDFGTVAVAGLVGMFSKQATNKLDELFSTLFKTDKDKELGGKLANKPPVLTAVSPQSITAGSGDTQITVTGTDFVDKCEVRWQGTPIATQFVKATEVTATVPAAKLASAGAFEVIVHNPPPAGGPSNVLKVTVS